MKDLEYFFKALADVTRIQMVWLLLNKEELCVCDFIEVLKVSQSKASRHLRYLFHAGIVMDRRAGQWIHYSLTPELAPRKKEILAIIGAISKTNKEAKTVLADLNQWLKNKKDRLCCEKDN